MSNDPVPRRPLSLIHKTWFWDALILFLIIAPSSIAWLLLRSTSHPLGIGAAFLLVAGSLTVAYGSFIESRLLTMNKKSIQIKRLPKATIAIAADFHVGPYKGRHHVARVVERINALQPDLILLPGDFLFDHNSDVRWLEPLAQLRSTCGIFAVIGNHDSGDHATLGGETYSVQSRSEDVVQALRNAGITVLRDEWIQINLCGADIAIAGIEAPWASTMDVASALQGLPPSLPLILLSHNPDVVLKHDALRADMIVSGHTHGGQIRLPFIGPLHVPAETGKKYAQGIFAMTESTTLVVTHGVGETLARARLLCPPEVMVLQVNGA